MNQLEKMQQIYNQIKATVINDCSSSGDAQELVNSDFTDKLVSSVEMEFPFQYSSEEDGIYFFTSVETFKEYVLERLSNEDIISSDDYYESSDDEWQWQSSSC